MGRSPQARCPGRLLRARRRAAHRHRRQRGPGLPEPGVPGGRRVAARRAALARDAIRPRRGAARPLGDEAAHGIRAVANANMARAIRSVTIERGRDPRDFTSSPSGAAARCTRATWPPRSTSAACSCRCRPACSPRSGCSRATSSTISSARQAGHSTARAGGANARLDEMGRKRAPPSPRKGTRVRVRLESQADLRYVGQASELMIPIRRAVRADADRRAALSLQSRVRRDLRLRERRGAGARQRARGRHRGPVAPPRLPAAAWRPGRPCPPPAGACPSTGAARGATRRWSPREALTAAGRAGPLIIESYDSTVVVPPGGPSAATRSTTWRSPSESGARSIPSRSPSSRARSTPSWTRWRTRSSAPRARRSSRT